MMKLHLSFTYLLLSWSLLVFSQDDKKEWAKKLKAMDPLALKALYEERDQLKSDVEGTKSQLQAKDDKIAELEKQITEVKANTIKMPAEANETDVSSSGYTRGAANPQGVIFKVQIGAFKNKDLSKYFENNKNFSGDVDADGTKKYTLGYFSDYWEADRFKKYLREMGVKDAWIVPYKDGKRLNIKDVLEGVVK